MNDKKTILRRLSAVQFALWELHMYLDTHPSCQMGLAQCKKYTSQFAELKAEYENRFGRLEPSCEGTASWVSDPFPWEYNFEEDN